MNRKESVRQSKLLLDIKHYLEINGVYPVYTEKFAKDILNIVESSYKKRDNTLKPKLGSYGKVEEDNETT